MKITVHETKIICENKNNPLHGYFAWPSVARLGDGRLAMTASGFRMRHICPFGKAVICYSSDEGESWTPPTPVIDTPLDDRDAGILPLGKDAFLVTSFNNSIAAQRAWNHGQSAYIDGYLDAVDAPGAEAAYLGSTLVFTENGGADFSKVYRVPVTSPHGPLLTKEGEILYIGRTFSEDDSFAPADHICAFVIHKDGMVTYRGKIENVSPGLSLCEPHALQTKSGRILVHIRAQGEGVFTTYQSESDDGGVTFTKPHRLLDAMGGAPAHLLDLEDGRIISVHGDRQAPYGIKCMISEDEGASWSTGEDLYVNGISPDLGYPASVKRKDGTILTVFYAHPDKASPAVILQTIWSVDEG